MAGFSPSTLGFSVLIITPPLRHERCHSSDQAADFHTLDPKSRAFSAPNNGSERGWQSAEWIYLTTETGQWLDLANVLMNPAIPNGCTSADFSKSTLPHASVVRLRAFLRRQATRLADLNSTRGIGAKSGFLLRCRPI